MEFLERLSPLLKGMSVFPSQLHQYMFTNKASDFLLNPILLRLITGNLHLVLLLIIVILWACQIVWINHNGNQNQGVKPLYHKATLLSCLGLSFFNLLLCILNNFYWYKNNGWSDEKILTLIDLAVKTLAWLALYAFLHKQSLSCGLTKYPLVLRVWWGVFFSLSCYCLVVDLLYYKMHQFLSSMFWLSDIVSSVMGLLLCYLSFSGSKESEEGLLQEPLLSSIETNDHKNKTVSPYASASVFSILTFSWVGPLISTGYKKLLNLEDIPQLSSVDSAREAFPLLDSKLKSYGRGSDVVTSFTLAKGLIFTAWKESVLGAICMLVYTFAMYVGPYLIDSFVQYLSGRRNFQYEGYALVSAFFFAKVLECFVQRHGYFKVQQAGYRARSALVAKIYHKGLMLSCQSKQGSTTGEIINLMSVDAPRIGVFGFYMHYPWMAIIQVGLALVILYRNLGLASVATLVASVLVMLVNIPLGKLEEKFQQGLMKSKDKRMKATSEVLRNMRILKLQAWEMKFLSKIYDLRNVETGWLRKYAYISSAITLAFSGAHIFVSLATFGSCLLMGIPLTSGKILSALATFEILQGPMYSLPDMISVFVQTKPDVTEKLPPGSSSLAVQITNGNFAWDISSPHPTLKDINLRLSHGTKIAVCGTVGSGKSTLLSCILGEVPKLSGTVRLCGEKAYVGQSAWILSGTIEENILFGKEMDKEQYNRVLEACSLKKDLEILSYGDQTIIGERGINLSGGQKQRIQIARALYHDADIYLFDDPFSAVDAHTGTHLFNECILGLLDSKTVIFVTHQVDFLPAADLVLVMKDGRITQAGKYGDIFESGTDFMDLVGAHEEALSALTSIEAGATLVGESYINTNTNEALKKNESQNEQDDTKDNTVETREQLVQEEERSKGRVGLSIYRKYLTTAYGGLLVPVILLAQVLFMLFEVGSDYWMAWASPVSEDMTPIVQSFTLIIVYFALQMGSSICILAKVLLLVEAGFKTATIFFNRMHLCIFRAPMSFFDSTPSGRILNRVSEDQSAVDLSIPFLIAQSAFSMIQLFGTIVIISQVAWQIFIIFIPVVTVCIWLQQYYLPSARELTRLVGVCKAPVIQHFSETLSGLNSVKQLTSMKLIDDYSRPMFHTAAAMQWLCIWLDMLSLFTFASSLVFLISVPEGKINPSLAGLAVTYGLSLNTMQAMVVWNLCFMENKMISVERILQYTSIPNEPPLLLESNRPESRWPAIGEVNIHNLQVRYAPHMPLVLRGLTCTLFGGKKTGIVGRTGSGKSTLIQTLFRIIDPSAGRILIDNVDISSIGLHDLRSRLSIIPQDPTMFEGTIRSNMDPLEEYTDEQIWEALDKCHLGDEVRKKADKLDSTVVENGENWSVGQRQLVCLGRVLLKKSKILVLDEATSSVDTATDNLIQQTLQQHFFHSTVITVAHRITSVLDSNMVLLLDQGLIKEYDTPKKLLEDKSSSFAKLVAEYSIRSTSA
ncbi:Multidrug resistance-associated protein/mitoxantrone resistance protein, ABC superfamily [Handroanthus impetiginosus]|uniref:ABC-type xenobiotic transporter n=1 Tax=Handroanthus impetiginosus TaxID=429701 RepID=A0A2G9HIX3_9LAMI|nr:Multidrug resistance-associated protein/mitoxantrone resistance protein, ABC superfamily [Handroanthus impetiginosus]